MSRKILLLNLLVLVFVASFVSACSSSKKTPAAITVQLAPPAPASLQVSTTVQLTAQTVNDTAAAGVDWTVTCTSSDCGSLAPAHTASGGATTYTAPATVPTGGSVTITAASTTTPASTATATITITPIGSNASLTGQYAIAATGIDANGFYAVAGSITTDGNGNITGGEEDFSDPTTSALSSVLGTYTIGSDGRGTLTLNTSAVGTQVFSVAISSSSHGLIIEADGVATSSGTIDLQSSASFVGGVPGGTLVFTTQGWDLSDSAGSTFGGALNTTPSAAGDGSGTIVTGALDFSDEGFVSSIDLSTIPDLGYTVFDGNGRSVLSSATLGLSFSLYMVTPGVYRAVETDNSFVEGGSFMNSAPAFAVSSTNVSTWDPSQLTGPFVFSDNGQESGSGAVGFVGQFTTDGVSAISAGFSDSNEAGVVTSAAVTGTYAFPSDFAGNLQPRLLVQFATGNGSTGGLSMFFVYLGDPTVNVLDPNNPIVGAGALLADADAVAVGTGSVVEQSPAVFQGNYAVGLQLNAQNSDEEDFVGQGLTNATTSTITGNGDIADSTAFLLDIPLVVTYAADPNNPGRFTATLSLEASPPLDFVIYQTSTQQSVMNGVDPTFVGIGSLIQQ
jgi:Tfp pilus assembly protein PilX